MRLTKPPKDNPHAVFKYGVECGVDQERERIIALLESQIDETTISPTWIPVALAIALIKGETNDQTK